jgi:uncharacterized protein (TIGR03437 family)
LIRRAGTISIVILLVAVPCPLALGQAPPPTILAIDLENYVEYQDDGGVPSKYATNPNITPAVMPTNFFVVTMLGDIVAVNGQAAKGTFVGRTGVIRASPIAAPGFAIADVQRAGIREQIFEILQSDGTPVGTIMGLGLSGGSTSPPGAPWSNRPGNFAIVGGTGAFLGARGQESGFASPAIPSRSASMTEDPANRRTNGGGSVRYILHVIPMAVPQIANTPQGPAVTHASSFSLVTAAKPAAAGEILSLFASGLGPTVPGVDPGQPFPASPLAAVNSPVEVTVNGKPADVLGAAGFPGAVDGYQVNFRLPPDTARGLATIQLSAAWIPSAPVNIAVQ